MDLVIDDLKVKNKCQIFTPDNIVEKMLDLAGYKNQVFGKKVLENSCGDGQILSCIVKKYIECAIEEGVPYKKIKLGLAKDITGIDIDSELVKKCKKRLSETAKKYGIQNVKWNIQCQDFLLDSFCGKYDYIIGNPPYISYLNLQKSVRKYIRDNYETCRKGKFDYCYAFIEKSYKSLSNQGVLIYIIPSNIFKNVFASEIRTLIKQDVEQIYDFPNDKIFSKALVSPAIIKIVKGNNSKTLQYTQDIGGEIDDKIIEKTALSKKWIFETSSSETGVRVGDFFQVSSCIATLLNEAFVLKNCKFDDDYCYTNNEKIERDLVKKAISPKNKKYKRNNEYIIFPYYYNSNGVLSHYSEIEMKEKYPCALQHLSNFREKLDARKADKTAKWYEYGRSQALQNANKEMILISSVISECTNAYLLNQDEIPYSGLYIIPTGNISLSKLLEQLNSNSFITYISKVGVCVSGQSKRITPKDIEDFICDIN